MVVIADDFLHPRIVVIVIGSFTPVWYNSKMVSMIIYNKYFLLLHGRYSKYFIVPRMVVIAIGFLTLKYVCTIKAICFRILSHGSCSTFSEPSHGSL